MVSACVADKKKPISQEIVHGWDDVSRAEVMVLGAGRGPLVEAAVKAAEKAEAVAE